MDAAKIFWGLVFIVLGILLILSTLGHLPWAYWWKLWPLVFIFLGILILLSKPLERRGRKKDQE